MSNELHEDLEAGRAARRGIVMRRLLLLLECGIVILSVVGLLILGVVLAHIARVHLIAGQEPPVWVGEYDCAWNDGDPNQARLLAYPRQLAGSPDVRTQLLGSHPALRECVFLASGVK